MTKNAEYILEIINNSKNHPTAEQIFLLLKEKIRLPQAACIIVAFLGALLVVKPGMSGMPVGPALIGVLGGAGAGTASCIVRLLQKRGVPGPFIVFFFSAFSRAIRSAL